MAKCGSKESGMTTFPWRAKIASPISAAPIGAAAVRERVDCRNFPGSPARKQITPHPAARQFFFAFLCAFASLRDKLFSALRFPPSAQGWLAAALCASALFSPPPTAFRAKFNLVRVLATVKTQAGQIVGTLAKEDFEIYDNGVKQRIAVFEHQTEQQLSVVLLVDTSGSTAKDLKYESDSAARFLHA